MTALRRYIFALLVAGLLLVQLGQAQHYKIHFLEPGYQSSPQKHAPAHSEADDNCAFCLFLKSFVAIFAAVAAVIISARIYIQQPGLQQRLSALMLPQLYAARAPPVA